MHDTDTTQWPPPPLHPSTDVQDVSRIRIVRNEDRLRFLYLDAKRDLYAALLFAVLGIPLLIGMNIFVLLASSGGKAASDGTLHRFFVEGVWPLRLEIICIPVILTALSVFTYVRAIHHDLFALDKQQNAIQRGGKNLYPLTELTAVIVAKSFDTNWIVRLVRIGGDKRPRWLRVLTYPEKGAYIVTAFRHREDAEQLAAALIDFAGVEVQYSSK